jgi:hypothetical protein
MTSNTHGPMAPAALPGPHHSRLTRVRAVVPFHARGILPVAEEQSRTRGGQSGGVEDQPQYRAVCGFPAVWVVCRGVRCGLRLVAGEGAGAGAGRRHIGWGLCDHVCLVFVCRGRNGGVVLLFILGSNLGGEGPVKGLRGGGRRGWCEEWARSS